MLIMLYKVLAMLCIFLAGWALGTSNSTWEADVEGVRDDGFMPRLYAIGNSWSRLRLFGGNPMAGTGALAIWLLAGVVFAALGFPEAMSGMDSGSSRMERRVDGFMLLLQPVTWLLLGSFAAGYVICKVQQEKDDTPRY